MEVVVPHPQRIEMIGTGGGDLSDPAYAMGLIDREAPPSSVGVPRTFVLDLRGKLLSPVSLKSMVLTLGQRIRGGVYGDAKLLVLTSHPDIRDLVDLLASQHDLPIFVTDSEDTFESARPAGALTLSERETLDELQNVGGRVTVASLAGYLGIEPSAANNRLVNIEKKGYVYRFKRGRRDGDLFVDPRAPVSSLVPDPYTRTRAVLEGEAAERAAEILGRRHKTG